LEAASSDGTSSNSTRNGRAEKEAAAAAMAGAERVRSTMVAEVVRASSGGGGGINSGTRRGVRAKCGDVDEAWFRWGAKIFHSVINYLFYLYLILYIYICLKIRCGVCSLSEKWMKSYCSIFRCYLVKFVQPWTN
jgi:hypothetical protein